MGAEGSFDDDGDDLDDLSGPVRLAPVVLTPSVTGRDDLDVPRGLRVAAAWTWRLLLLALAGFAVLWLVGSLA